LIEDLKRKAFDCDQLIKLLSFLSKRGHLAEKHVLTGRKHDMLSNQTFEIPRANFRTKVGKLSTLLIMVSIHKYCRNFKLGIPLFKDFRNEVIQMVAMRQISETCERYRVNRSF